MGSLGSLRRSIPTSPLTLAREENGKPENLYREISRRFGVDRHDIESIAPCTPLQCDVLESAYNDARHSIGRVIYNVPEDVEAYRLAAAWKETVDRTPALRAFTFTAESEEPFQVVLKDCFLFSQMYWTSPGLKTAIANDEAVAAAAGARCNRFVLLDDMTTRRRVFIWTFSHALVDNAYQQHILCQVLAAYKDGHGQLYSLPVTPDPSEGKEDEDLSLSRFPQALKKENIEAFWQGYLQGLDAAVFPHLSSHHTVPDPKALAEHRVQWSSPTKPRWSSTIVCQAALSILLCRYTNSEEALFGIMSDASLAGQSLHLVDGPTQTVTPVRMHCSADASLARVMTSVELSSHLVQQVALTGLRNIQSTGDDGLTACGFQTVLRVSDSRTETPTINDLLEILEESEKFVPCANRALLLHCEMTGETATLTARFDEDVIEPAQIERLLRQLGSLICQLHKPVDDSTTIEHLNILTSEDQEEIHNWNSDVLQVQDSLVHGEILNRVSDSPSKPAVAAWDGEWTYAELDDVSSRLAGHILSLDTENTQKIIPVYLEKSKWVIASMLAVLKAGHAFTLIDPNDPPARVAQIIRQTSATVALTSKVHSSAIEDSINHCIPVSDVFPSLPAASVDATSKRTAEPEDLAYVIFTSGSTGEPKGIMIEHRAFASCVAKFGPALGIRKDSRVLQFAAHGFGACLLETLPTLIAGGCVCIPSDHDRMHNVPDFIRRYSVTWMMSTPSFMRTFQPEDVPGLQTLVLVGEQMSASVNNIWAAHVELLDGYGQSESSSICFVGKISTSSDPNNLGRSVGAHSWIVDPDDPNRLAPVGAVGELLIESPGIARGYIAAPVTEKSPFLQTVPTWYPAAPTPGVKFYRTGDLARYACDGTVVCLGRIDSQVKIRGQRVEMSAVESRLRQQLPSDTTVVVEAVRRTEEANSTVIAAFLIETRGTARAEPDNGIVLDQSETAEMNDTLHQHLPRYFLPTFYIRLSQLPRTATGKVDRRRLRAIGGELLKLHAQGARSKQVEAPITQNDDPGTKLRQIWVQGLGLAGDFPNSAGTFFELGGDSIIAIKMVNMARSAGFELKVFDLLQNPTLSSLQSSVDAGSAHRLTIPRSTWNGPVEQSYSQGRMWFLEQLETGASWYLIPYAVRLRGQLQISALNRALRALEQRHETLRTTFRDQNGVGMQIVHDTLWSDLAVTDFSSDNGDYLQALATEQTAGFDLSSKAGWRASLMRLGDEDHVLSIVMHHIISDGWSIDLVRQELGHLYSAALHGRDPLSALSPMPIQYRDFSAWQKEEAQAAEQEEQLQYWEKQLADCMPAKLPTDFPRPALLSGNAGTVPVEINGELYEKLHNYCNFSNTSIFAVLLATFRAAHYRLTGVDDALIGTPIANRNRQELETLIGFFVNTQCMRITVDSDDTFEGLIRQVRSTTTAAFEHEDVPFERIVSKLLPGGSRDLSQTPLVQLIFAIHSQKNLGKFELEGLESEALTNNAATRFDAEFHLFQAPGGLKGYVNYAAELFKHETIQNVVSVFFQILRHGLEQPQTRISVLPLTEGLAELRNLGLLDIKRVDYPRDMSIVDVFRAQVAAFPDVVAVVDSSTRLTYTQLDAQSELLAGWLRRQKLAPETLVAVLAPRSCQTILAFLGILKANLAYLPLDVRSPVARTKDILSTLPGRAIVLMGTDVSPPDLGLSHVELVTVTDTLDIPGVANGDVHTESAVPSATSLAYVVYTSGSTGRPKGVMVEHRPMVRLVKGDVLPNLSLQGRAVMAHMFNAAFDGASYEIWYPLLNGGTVVCVDYMTTLNPSELEALFVRERVNAAIIAPALLKMYLNDARDALRGLDMLMAAGDRFDPQDAKEAQKLIRGQVYNGYGPTENGVMSTVYAVDTEDLFMSGVPIGRPIHNSGGYITDTNQQLVGPGVMGELVVTGDGLARGYTIKEVEKDRFIQMTIDGECVRAYRTGDRARYRVGEGVIEFFGRMDFQFKIRSNRIETAEVEAAILSQPSISDAAVVLRVQEEREPEIIGFVVAEDEANEDETDKHVEGWEVHFDRNMYTDLDVTDPSTIGRDFKGWVSMYDGNDMNKTELNDWLDDTIEALHDGQAAGHVLEIGTGSGMILFNLRTGLESYVGLEPSKSAAAFANNVISSLPALAGKAEVHVGTAADIGHLNALRPDLVIINSVAQYFPTREYLANLVETLVHLPTVKRIFFGDMRSHATNTQFLAARAIHALGNNTTKENARKKMTEVEEHEEELLVAPAFFTSLKDQFPGLVKHVEILPKNLSATNELSAYRYAAVLHLRDAEVRSIDADDWLDFQASQMGKDALREHLRLSETLQTVAISDIPYSHTMFERHLVDSLNDGDITVDGAAWIAAARADADSRTSFSVPDLVQLALESGFRVEVSAARQWSQSGGLDAVFHRYASPESTSRTLFQFPTDHQACALTHLSNRPLQTLQRRRAVTKIRDRLQTLLPSYMIPAHIVALDKMPLNANGKVDRKELARRAKTIVRAPRSAPVRVSPINEIEVVLCEEASAVFGMDVNINDQFFTLGGHSLLATKLIARVGNRLNARLTVKDVFDHPVFSDLAAATRKALAQQNAFPVAQESGPTRAGSAGVAPRTDMERMLCEEFANVLGIDVGITDNFFDLGGHSLMATKLTARIGHRLDTSISVKYIFEQPVLFQLAVKLELAQTENTGLTSEVEMPGYAPFQLLTVDDVPDFIAQRISPQVELQYGKIMDVYPTSHMQRAFLCDSHDGSPKHLVPFYIDFPAGSNSDTLIKACNALIDHLDLFRTVFVDVAGSLFQVVLDHIDVPIDVVETQENVHAATSAFVDNDAKDPVYLNQPLIRVTILKQASSLRVLLRLSHALYDGLSLEYIVRSLHMLYESKSLPPTHQFSRYMQFVAHSAVEGHAFWRDVIQNAPIATLPASSGCTQTGTIYSSKIIGVPPKALKSSKITQATVFNAACALVLSKESGSSDVVFGRIISGRQGLPVGWQSIIGPCTNAVPVRAHVDKGGDHQQLLRDLQDQYLLTLPYETMGFDEVKRHCTNWPESAKNYGCCVTYHNFEYHPESEMGQQRVEMGVLAKQAELEKEEPLYDLAIAAEVEPDGVHLKVTAVAKARMYTAQRAEDFLEGVCKAFETLNLSL